MKLENLIEGEVITRDELLSIQGGMSDPSLTGTGKSRTQDGAYTNDDYSDGDGD